MPTYDYKCKDCKDTFEHFQKMTDEPLKVCDKCGGHLVRLIGTGLKPVFKGKGFYETDYKNNNTASSKTKKTTEPTSTSKSVTEKPTQKKSA